MTFKKGDRVKCLKQLPGVRLGSHYTVERIVFVSDTPMVILHMGLRQYPISSFSHVNPLAVLEGRLAESV